MSAPERPAPHIPGLTAARAFLGLWLFVIFVSVLDGYLALRYRDTLWRHELNPLGRALLSLGEGQVWLLLGVKFAGTVIAAGLTLWIFEQRPRWGLTIAAYLALAQLVLLLFLLLA